MSSIRLGLAEIAITDHVDYGIKYDWSEIDPMPYRQNEPLANVNSPAWNAELESLRKQHAGQITNHKGMEFVMQTGTVRKFETLFHRYDFDFIILSCPQVDNQEYWTGEFLKGKSQEEYHHRYDEEILAVMKQYRDYSALGHMDPIVRDDPAGVFPFEKTEDRAA